VPNKKGLSIYVDYAHKVEALQNVLTTLKEITKGKLITVFGCGGNRDIIKRPLMAKVSEEFSDYTIVTSDNPRNEDPEKIINDILQGFTNPSKAIVEINRKEAIKKAIQMAKKEDVIIIAGKGHETYQVFANQTIDFDDRKIAKELCE
jgi:UDP-N-acetylmuramoyl-L-alanyl-D-glutamate--2,6-diaminopimelate ligase